MSERGVFAVDRGIWDHPSFADEPLTEREAWAWLIGEASFKARKKRVGNAVFDLKRGQLVSSIRFMAEAWQWHRNKVFRFLRRLKTETMIDLQSGHDATVITVCNYDKYQRVSLPDVTTTETQSGTPTGHQRDKLEDTEDKEIGSEAIASAPSGAPVYTDSRHELWGEGVPILISLGVADKLARSNIGRWLKTMRDDAQAVLGAIQRARDNRIVDPIPWITQALRGPQNGNASSTLRTDQTSRSPQTRDATVIAGMAGALDRRRAARAAAETGQQGVREGRGAGPAGGADAEPGPAGGDEGAHRQLALLPAADAG